MARNDQRLTEKELKALGARLPRGYQRLAAERLAHQYTRAYIAQVKTGERFNQDILDTLFELAELEDKRKARNKRRAIGTTA